MDFKETYNRYWHAIFCFALSRLNKEDAEDVTADTFIQYWRNRDKVPATKIRAFLFVVATNKCNDKIRRSARRKQLLNDLQPPVTDDWQNSMDVHMLRNAIERLHGKARIIIRLHLQGYSTGDIACLLGKSVQTVYNQKSKAIQDLRSML